MSSSDYTSRRKREARAKTIVAPYRRHYAKLPSNRHYFSLTGLLADSEGELKPSCEPQHLAEEGLISTSQYHGAEWNDEKHRLNTTAVRSLPKERRPTLLHGDFVRCLERSLHGGCCRPGIVHLDTETCPRRGLSWFADTILLLNHYCRWPVMLVWNSVVETHRYRKLDFRHEYELADQDTRLGYALDQGGWKQLDPHYEYGGSRGKTPMRAYTFWKGL